MGLRIGTPDAEATITTRSARLDPGYSYAVGRRLSRRRPTHSFIPSARGPRRSTAPRARPPPTARSSAAPTRDPVGGPAREPGGRFPVLALPPQVPDLRHREPLRVQPGRHRGQPGRRPGHHTVRGTEGFQGQQLAVHDGDDHGCRGYGPARDQVREQREARRHVGIPVGDVPARAHRRGRPPPARGAGRAPAAGTSARRPAGGPAPRRRARRRPAPGPPRRRPPDRAVHRPALPTPAPPAGSPPPPSPAIRGGSPGGCAARRARRGPVRRPRRPRAAPRSGRAGLSETSLR